MIKFENKSNGRFYYLSVQKDMLGDNVLVITRGGSNAYVSRTLGIKCELAIHDEIRKISKRRIARGYSLVI